MRSIWGVILIVVLLTLLTACDVLNMVGYDEEISQIIKDGDYKACKELTSDTEGKTQTRINKCYNEAAFSFKNVDICEEITDKNKQRLCIMDLAEDMKRIDYCEKITYPETCILNVAIAKKDESYCKDLGDTNNDKCFSEIGKARLDPILCERVDEATEQARCYSHIAAEKKDMSICKEIYDERNQEMCISNVAFVIGDPELCKESETTQNLCYFALAKKQKDPTLCDKITTFEETDSCYDSLADYMNDYQLCSKISEQKDKLECAKRFAKTDVNACEILSGNYKEDCLDSLENYI